MENQNTKGFLNRFKDRISVMSKDGHIGVVLNANKPIQKQEDKSISKTFESYVKRTLPTSQSPRTKRNNAVANKIKIQNSNSNIKIISNKAQQKNSIDPKSIDTIATKETDNSTRVDEPSTKTKVPSNPIMYSKKIGKTNQINFTESNLVNSSKPLENNKLKKIIPAYNKGRRSEREYVPKQSNISSEKKQNKPLIEELNNSAYENHEPDDIKYFDGVKQRDTPTFNVIRTKIQPTGEFRADTISASAIYKGLLPSGTDRYQNSSHTKPQFEGSINKKNKNKYLHERNESNITLPKLRDSIELSKIEDLENNIPQTEHKLKRSKPDTHRSKSQLQKENFNIYKLKSRNDKTVMNDIKTGGKSLLLNSDIKDSLSNKLNFSKFQEFKTRKKLLANLKEICNDSNNYLTPYKSDILRSSFENKVQTNSRYGDSRANIVVSAFGKSSNQEEVQKIAVQPLNESLPSISFNNSRSENAQYLMKINSCKPSEFSSNTKSNISKQTEATKETLRVSPRINSRNLYANEGMLRAKSYNNCNNRKKILIIKDEFADIDDFLLSRKNDSFISSKQETMSSKNYFERISNSYKKYVKE